jgi:hypothetical protein
MMFRCRDGCLLQDRAAKDFVACFFAQRSSLSVRDSDDQNHRSQTRKVDPPRPSFVDTTSLLYGTTRFVSSSHSFFISLVLSSLLGRLFSLKLQAALTVCFGITSFHVVVSASFPTKRFRRNEYTTESPIHIHHASDK